MTFGLKAAQLRLLTGTVDAKPRSERAGGASRLSLALDGETTLLRMVASDGTPGSNAALFPSKLEALWRRTGEKVEGDEHSLPNAGRCVVLVSGGFWRILHRILPSCSHSEVGLVKRFPVN
ncbi:uncharacterized protein ACBT57_021608 isoform 1-T1 [Dama dama]